MKRFIEIKHNLTNYVEENVEIVPVDYIEKVYKHYLGERVGEYAIAVVWNCPIRGRVEFIERRYGDDIERRWREIEAQLLGEYMIPMLQSPYRTPDELKKEIAEKLASAPLTIA